jgi:hypothetical protein
LNLLNNRRHCYSLYGAEEHAQVRASRKTPLQYQPHHGNPFLRFSCVPLSGRAFVHRMPVIPAHSPPHGKRCGHRKGGAARSTPPFAALTARAASRGIRRS